MMVYDEERGGEQWDMNCFFGYLQEVYDGIDSCDGYVNLLIYLEQGTPSLGRPGPNYGRVTPPNK